MSKQKIVIKKRGIDDTQDTDNKESTTYSTTVEVKEVPPTKVVEPPKNHAKETKPSPNLDLETATTKSPLWQKILWFILGIVTMIAISFAFNILFPPVDSYQADSESISTEGLNELTNIDPLLSSPGENIDYEKNILSEKMSLRNMLVSHKVAEADAKKLDQKAISPGINDLNPGDKYTIIFDTDKNPLRIMLEPRKDPYNKYLIDFDKISIEKIQKNREVVTKSMGAIIEQNLGVTFINNNLDLKIINQIEEIFAWSVDLFTLGDGDRFKVLYEQEYLDGKPNQILDIKAAYFNQNGTDIYAFRYKHNNKVVYYNEFGQSMRKSFLKTPLKYGGVITSGFGLRVHPVQQYSKMHYGTDYAAPEGTPIQSVADGVITRAEFSSSNGNNVKVEHDKTYTTQYLHMTRWADGISPGVRVRQGDIIGYVGSTGMSTGNHVCFRFWKNNEQVDPKKERVGTASQIDPKIYTEYIESIKPVQDALKKIEYL